MNYMINPDVIEYERKYNAETKKIIADCKIESEHLSKQNIDYKIIVIDNAQHGTGMVEFIKTNEKYIDKHVKIFLYRLKSIEYVIGPVYIDSTDKIMHITNHIVNFIRSDFYTERQFFKERIMEYFKDTIDNQKMLEMDAFV